ncbi:MAG TPA: lysozyme inhibitor LprI family protein [Neobacillus sp.]
MRKNPIDDTTFALKKVEGDTYDILDGLLNEIYGVLKEQLPSEEMDQLRKEQREWLTYRDNTAKEASLKYKAGTMEQEQYEYTRVENNLTEERCFDLVEDYMK